MTLKRRVAMQALLNQLESGIEKRWGTIAVAPASARPALASRPGYNSTPETIGCRLAVRPSPRVAAEDERTPEAKDDVAPDPYGADTPGADGFRCEQCKRALDADDEAPADAPRRDVFDERICEDCLIDALVMLNPEFG